MEGACQLCLKEIDISRPFFLGMLGSRSVPQFVSFCTVWLSVFLHILFDVSSSSAESFADAPSYLRFVSISYGWIPPTYGITAQEESFDWCRDLPVTRSITELEILHGFLWPHERKTDGCALRSLLFLFLFLFLYLIGFLDISTLSIWS